MAAVVRNAALSATALVLAGCEEAPSALDPHGPGAERIAGFAWLLVALLSAVYVAVVVLLALALRSSRRDAPAGRPRRLGGTRLGVAGGIVVPAVILFGLMLVTARTTGTLAAARGDGGPADVEVIGHQFWWEVRYAGEDFVTANEIHIPVGRAVRLELTSSDVIHSFWVPELHGKVDMTPGKTTALELEATRPGVYRGQCAEYCGIQHARMALLVVAEPPEEHAAWLGQQRRPAAEPADAERRRGARVFLDAGCGACHAIAGTEADGDVGPDLTHFGARRTIAAATFPNTRGHLAGWIVDPQAAKPGNRMPPTTLPPDDLHALVAYLEGLD